jgi:DNA-binding transcriptional MerR regulator
MVSTTPAFNLKVVLNETGIAADTLRAWERRYGLPMPQRSAGGHRLYSQRDIETIKWLMKRQVEGLSISRAVELWKEQLASGADPLAGPVPSTLLPASNASLDSLRQDWIAACMSFNEPNAEQILNQAFSMFPVEAVCTEVLQKGLSEIGDLWYANRLSVQQEHFASGLAVRRLDALLNASPAPTRNQTIIIGCPAEEWHTFTPLLLALLVRRRGLNVLYLGANVPILQFTDTVKSARAELVVLVAQHLISAASLKHTALVLSSQKIRIAFGGRIFNLRSSLADSISGHFLGHDLPSALEEIERMLAGQIRNRPPKSISQAYATTHQAFVAKRAQVEMTLRETLQPLSIAPEDIERGIHFLGNHIAAALQLGDIQHVSEEIDWIRTLLHAHAQPEQYLVEFMEAYAQAVNKHLNGSGILILEWLSGEVQKLRTE